MYLDFMFLLAASASIIAANPLGTKAATDPITLLPVDNGTHSVTIVTISMSSMYAPTENVVPTSNQYSNDPAAANLAAAIASPLGDAIMLAAPATYETSAEVSVPLPAAVTSLLSFAIISDTALNLPSTSSDSSSIPSASLLSFSVLKATVSLGSVLSTSAQYVTGLSAVFPITRYPSQSPTWPVPRIPAGPEESLSSFLKNTSHSHSIPTSSIVSKLYLPTGVPPGNMATLPANMSSPVPTPTATIDPGALLKNVTAAIQILKILTILLKADSGDVSAVIIPEIGTSIGNSSVLTGLLRGMVLSLLG